MNLEYFEVRILPYNYAGMHNGTEKVYEITVKVDGGETSRMRNASMIPPAMTEIEFLTRMSLDIIGELRDKQDKGDK